MLRQPGSRRQRKDGVLAVCKRGGGGTRKGH